jgi:hypothetical protein
LELKQVLANGDLLVRNIAEAGKRTVSQVEGSIEKDLVYPAIRGADIERWKAMPRIFTLLTQDPDKREPYPESVMKKKWPKTFGYLTRFKDVLLSRGSKSIRELAERTAFYAMFGVGPYTVARFKVVWQFMSQDIFAAVVSQHKTPFGFRLVIPMKTVALIACDNEAEAHYLCALLNSTPVRDFVKSYSSAGRGFGAPSVVSHIGVPKFGPTSPLHRKLSQLSQSLHELKAQENLNQLPNLEKELDETACKLFGIK